MLVPALIPTLITAFSKLAATLGPMIARTAPIVLKTVGENLPKVVQVIEQLSIASSVLKPNESVNELGAKAISADKAPEDFNQINDYIDYLRNDVTEVALTDEPTDVLACQAIGSAILLQALNTELRTDISLPFLNKVAEIGVGSKVVFEIVKAYSDSGLNIEQIEAYSDGQLSLNETKQHSDCLVSAYKNAEPTMTQQEAEQAVMKDF
ncbi:hypothetical protein J3455_02870 [Pseudoalteromonas sp. NFXS39]|uniref:hypothetical protein n=1 Tax=Pseudoalteromonas sp. NFXS39 TaxID=2818437 RepID=UPI0032E05638